MKVRDGILGVVLVVLFLLAFWTAPSGCVVGHPAGVVIYAQTAAGVHLLLADHRPPSTRGWGSFGGRHEPGESPAETAARETEEETRGYFHRAGILAAIGDEQPVYDGPFAQYFVQVEQFPVTAIAEATTSSSDRVYTERGPWAWVPYTEIHRLLDEGGADEPLRIQRRYLPADAHTDWVWPTWLSGLRKAIDQGALPWETETVETVAAEP